MILMREEEMMKKKLPMYKGWEDLPVGDKVPSGFLVQNKTATYRSERPVIDKEKCTECLICWIYCPEGTVKRTKEGIAIDYYHCKGCGICARECRLGAIKMVPEAG